MRKCMTGKLALSKAGHDKNTLYLIMKEEQETVAAGIYGIRRRKTRSISS